MPIYTEVTPIVLDLAREIIRDHHLSLFDARIAFVFRDEAPVDSQGLATLGKAAKVTPQMKAAGFDYDFLIWLAEDKWTHLGERQRRALIDHELTHCTIFDGQPRMLKHDIGEFTVIVERYGLWSLDLVKMGRAIEKGEAEHYRQLTLKVGEGMDALTRPGVVATITPDTKIPEMAESETE